MHSTTSAKNSNPENAKRPVREAQFNVLGPLEVIDERRECTPSPPKVRQVLALLVLRVNQVVYTDSLVQELWGENPPASALTTIQTYIYQLRKLIEREGLSSEGENVVVSRSPGYSLRVESEQIDLIRFNLLNQYGREHQKGGRYTEALNKFREALDLWTGDPLANVNLGPQLSAYVAEIQERRMNTLQQRIEVEMQLGLHRELLGELRSLVASHPFDECLHGYLMLTLDRCGRRRDALEVYHRLRNSLNEELGLDPSQHTQELHHQVLNNTTPDLRP
ncbi:AfsR/SARP family transcriptional regulator [Actinopolyspora sp. BKK1]|nr:AfsR/SARP family transcriptional regulator [Actinopolyspora sp. BKK2]NHE78437.1 AfsR/SARP family transcriptional regulator [Actinopolyspora sp. BKK1]